MTSRRRRSNDSTRPSRSEPFPVDVADRGDEFLVSAAVPGLRKQDIDVSVRKNRLRIVADFGDDVEGTVHRRERPRGTVRRVVTPPKAVDEKHVSASYDAGVLWVTLRKRRRRKRIEIE